jgi:hypothetical protein
MDMALYLRDGEMWRATKFVPAEWGKTVQKNR